MSVAKRRVGSWLARLITSPTRRRAVRGLAEWRRRGLSQPHRLHYFHRVDDPYSLLMVQVLPAMATRFGVELVPHVVSRLDDQMYPQKALLDRFDVSDAGALAALYQLTFPHRAQRRDPELTERLSLHLASIPDTQSFFAEASAIGQHYWSGRPLELPAATPAAAARLRQAEQHLARRGHYLSATVYYAGEWYWGLDRLAHLEQRLIDLRLAEGSVVFDRTFRGVFDPPSAPLRSPHPLELFFSARSPYSYIAYFQAQRLARALGLELELKPVLPMMMRGLNVPRAKRLYIVMDAKREAERAQLPFGAISDPLGAGIERTYAVAYLAHQQGQLRAFFDSALSGIAAEAIDVATDTGLRHVTERAGMNWSQAHAALEDGRWRPWVQEHRKEMADVGLWGVPCLRYGDFMTWGQDRFWRIRQVALQADR